MAPVKPMGTEDVPGTATPTPMPNAPKPVPPSAPAPPKKAL